MLYFKALINGLHNLPPKNLIVRNKIKKLSLKNKNLHDELYKIDPESSKKIHKNDFTRIERAIEVFLISGKTLTEIKKNKLKKFPYKTYQFAIFPEKKEILHDNIDSRLKKMLSLGFENEVKILFNRKDLNINLPSMHCIGYRQMWEYLSGNLTYENMIQKIIFATRKLVKHQLTWLRKWNNINFINGKYLKNDIDIILKIINE